MCQPAARCCPNSGWGSFLLQWCSVSGASYTPAFRKSILPSPPLLLLNYPGSSRQLHRSRIAYVFSLRHNGAPQRGTLRQPVNESVPSSRPIHHGELLVSLGDPLGIQQDSSKYAASPRPGCAGWRKISRLYCFRLILTPAFPPICSAAQLSQSDTCTRIKHPYVLGQLHVEN